MVLYLTVNETYRRVIQESATGWEHTKFEAAVREALALYDHGDITALLFPREDRETRWLIKLSWLTKIFYAKPSSESSGIRVH